LIAYDDGFVDSNPCHRVRKEKEGGKRERYLTFDEEAKLMKSLNGKVEHLRPPVIVSIGAGLRKSELLRLTSDHINFSDVPRFYPVNGRDVEIPPNFLLVIKSKNRKPRIVPMNPLVRTALSEAAQEAQGNNPVFSIDRNGVSYNAIRTGFETACDNAGITYGQTKPGGITWHDLRHTFATRVRAEGVDELDIMQLMGHSSVGVTAGYAHATPAVMQTAVTNSPKPEARLCNSHGKLVRK